MLNYLSLIHKPWICYFYYWRSSPHPSL